MALVLLILCLLHQHRAVYVPGGPGGAWSEDDISITRQRVLAMISPEHKDKEAMFPEDDIDEKGIDSVTENVLLRLAFHDCVRYKDGSGGCDGCLNWEGMGFRYRNFRMIGSDFKALDVGNYYYKPEDIVHHGANNGLGRVVKYLEKIYTMVDWPVTYTGPTQDSSLQESGKSRADLWAFAAWVALERSIERANRACDLDFHARQQTTLLESRDKCEVKLTQAYKFHYGRSDCLPTDPELPYATIKDEAHPELFGTGDATVDFVKKEFNMTASDFIALSAVHSAVHLKARHWILGTKYVWIGNSYISNIYHRMIANKPMYRWDKGGHTCFGFNNDMKARAGGVEEDTLNMYFAAIGDQEGNPVSMNGWRVGAQTNWNTTEGGPFFFRPTRAADRDSPNPSSAQRDCFDGFDENGNRSVYNHRICKDAYFDERGIQYGGKIQKAQKDKGPIGFAGNMFALPYEIGLSHKFEMNENHRPVGCPGLDDEEQLERIMDHESDEDNDGEVDKFRSGPAMDCDKNTYAPEGVPLHQIVENFADDHDVWAETFMSAWVKMQSNGYTSLNEADQSSWFGFYSLAQQGKADFEDFEDFIADNSPVYFTDPEADPYICGSSGGRQAVCGRKWSRNLELYRSQYKAPLEDASQTQ